MGLCTVDRVDPAHPRASGDCSPDVQQALDSPGLSSLPAPERHALVQVIRHGAGDEDLASAVHSLLDDPAFATLDPAERAAMVRQIAGHASAETARRCSVLLHDEALQALPRDLALHEIASVATATAPDADDLARGAGLQGPPRSHPHLWTMLAEGGLELAETFEAGHLLDGLGTTPLAGGAVVEAAAGALVPLIVALECADGIRSGVTDGREWGCRIAHGAGFAEGIARRLAGSSSDDVPSELRGQSAAMFRSGLRAADTALAELSPSERAALLASGGGSVRDDVRSLVNRRTILGR